MKKLMATVLMLAMFLSLGFVGGWNGRALADTPADRVGTYELAELYVDGEDYSSAIAASGESFSLVLYADGTACLNSSDGEFNFKWDEQYFDYGDSKSPYTFENGKLTLEEDGMKMVFQLTGSDTEKTAAAEPQELAGTWVGVADLRGAMAEESPDLAPYLRMLPVAVTMEMNADGTYSCTMDATTAVPAFKQAMRAYIVAMCEENNVTVADFEKSQGVSLDEYVDAAVEEMDMESLVSSATGKYTEKDGKVIWDPGADEVVGIYTGEILTFNVDSYGDVVLSRGQIAGTWIGWINVKDALVEGDEEMAEMLQFASVIPMYVVVEVKADGTYTMKMDGSAIAPTMRDALRAYIEDTCKKNNITVEQYEEAAGMTVDELLNTATEDVGQSDLGEPLEGTYTLTGTRLVLDPGAEETECVFENGCITIPTEDYGEIVFTRAGFLGTWSGKLYLADLMELNEDDEMYPYLKNVSLDVNVELRADGTYTLSLDGTTIVPTIKAAMRAYIEDVCKQNNTTVEAFEEAAGKPLDEYLDDALSEMDLDELTDSVDGEYAVKNGKVLFDGEQNGMLSGMWFGNTLILPLDESHNIVLTRK